MSKSPVNNNFIWQSFPHDSQDIFVNAPIGIFSSSPEGRYISVNPSMARILGYKTPEELMNSVTDIAAQVYFNPAERENFKYLLDKHGQVVNHECRLLRRDGTVFWASRNARAVRGDQGKILYYQGFTIDITDRKQAEQTARNSEKRYREILAAIEDGYYETNLAGKIVFCNQSAARMLGYTVDECIGLSFRKLCKEPNKIFSIFNQVLKSGQPEAAVTLEMIRKDGSIGYAELSITSRKNDKGRIIGFQGVGRDITQRKHMEEQLKYLSFHDQLTGLYNRTCFEYEMQRLSKGRDYPITIISMDVDGLKMVNDTLGHDYGDKVLKLCADLLQQIFRKSDILARTGGDEFSALLPGTDKQAGENVVGRIRAVIDECNRKTQAKQIPLGISIGIGVAEDSGKDLTAVFIEADDLMYRDKLSKDVTHRSRIMKSLLAALEERDFRSLDNAHRMEDLCALVGKRAGLPQKQLSDLALLVHLHDIGNVGIPDHILFKQGALTEEEWRIVHQHPEKGYRIVKASIDLAEIADLILKHHERWDGKGYPLGLKGEEIPVECRILSLVDAYDAMISDRPHRKAMSIETAREEIRKYAGTSFDPKLTQVFLEILESDDWSG